jgi:transposase
MKYTKAERLDIGRRIYEGEIGRYQAAIEYDIHEHTARTYMRLYRDTHKLPAKCAKTPILKPRLAEAEAEPVSIDPDLEAYASMTKEELIREIVRSKIREARLKKGYEVKGDGAEKVFIPLGNKNTK